MDRWKLKELYAMELGGNKNAYEYYSQNDMIRDGKPDHESAPHARYKLDLAQKCEAQLKANGITIGAKPQQTQQQPAPQATPASDNFKQADFMTNPFDMSSASNAPQVQKPVAQAQLQMVDFVPEQPKVVTQPKKVQQIQMQAPNASAGFAFARKQDNSTMPKAIGAKKLDFDFDANNDDFFNSFQPPAPVESNTNQLVEVSESSQKQEAKVNDPFEMASVSKPTSGGLGFDFGSGGPSQLNYLNKNEQYAADDRLKQLGNRKGISSADFDFDDSQKAQVQGKFQELNQYGATSISSDMMFGRASAADQPTGPGLMSSFQDNLMGRASDGSYDEYKEAAIKVADRLGEQASVMKASAMDWFAQFSAPN